MAYDIILDICGIVILLLLLIPHLSSNPDSRFNCRKLELLLYSALLHFFALCIRLTGDISTLALPEPAAGRLFRIVAVAPSLGSAVLLALCIFCRDNGKVRLTRESSIPVGQIACSVLPPVLAVCLRILFPGLSFWGIGWSVALHLVQSCVTADNERQLAEMEQKLNRRQAALMTVQMQPHFIFNTLSAIEALCQTDAQAAAQSIENLSGYLRANIDGLSSEMLIPFNDEFRHIRQYVALEQADPARQFHFDYELDVRDFKLPPLTIQPIVENAVKHGALTHRDGKGRVLLTTEAMGNYIRITVTDNGTVSGALTQTQQASRGIGIENTHKRLETLCNGSLHISVGKDGTKAVIVIPGKEG